MSSELYQTIEIIGREKGIDTDVIIHAVEEAYAAASRKYFHTREDFGARFDPNTGNFDIYAKHLVVDDDDLADPQTEITLEEARSVMPEIQLGETLESPRKSDEAPLTRIAAQAAKQVIYQKVKEAERELIYNEYHTRMDELLNGTVKRFDRGDLLIDLGRAEAVIPRREQSRIEHYNPGDRIRAVLVHVERMGKGPQLIISRSSEVLVQKLFEMEVPEIYDGTVEIIGVARDAGERSKIAVISKDRDVDPVGACVGMKGSRVQAVIRELNGEKIDIVQYDEDSANYVRNALSPAAVNRVAVVDWESRSMEVIVSEDQLSLAIGRRGQNVRLASKLVGWHLDIKSELEKKAEVEMEMERMAQATHEFGRLEGVTKEVGALLLNAGFLAVEEIIEASMDDLTSIEGIDQETAIDVHDAAEDLLEILLVEREEAEKIAAEEAIIAAEQAVIAAEEAAVAAELAEAEAAAAEAAEPEAVDTEAVDTEAVDTEAAEVEPDAPEESEAADVEAERDTE